jgi:photosystem II stability/assembly factor-like uncharacterized protein
MSIVKTYALTSETSPTGLYVSSDLGLTWTIATAGGLSTSNLTSLAASPFNSEVVLVGSASGISRSTDGGESFTNVYAAASYRLFYKDQDSIISIPNTYTESIAISDNNGGSFTPTATNILTQLAIGADISQPGQAVRTTAVFFTNNSSGFISVQFNDLVGGSLRNRIWRTTDGGFTWTNAIDLIVGSQIVSIHADLDADKVVVATESDGIWETDYALLGIITQNYTNTDIACGIGAKFQQVGGDPSKVYLITSSNAIYYSSNSGSTFDQRNSGLGSAFAYSGIAVFDENTLCTFYGASAEISRSTDGGVTLTSVFATNGRTVGFDSSVAYECGTCPEGFEEVSSGNFANPTISCERTILGGPLCNPPYFYDTVTKSCALPSSSIPFNIVLNVDTSGSIGIPTADERTKLILFLKLFIDEMSARLVTGNTKIAIVLWNSTACYQQEFTSDVDLLKEALDGIISPTTQDQPYINPACTAAGYKASGGTQHAVGFAESVRALHAQATLRPTAENVIITCTDGNGVGNANLTDLGYSTIVSGLDDYCGMIALTDEVKANLVGKPSKVMMLVVGVQSERDGVQNSFINRNCPGTSGYYPSLNDDNQPYYYDAGDFGTVADFAKQLVIGLEAQFIPSFSCPDNCTDVPGSDNLGYCSCTDVLPLSPCNYILTDCLDPAITITTNTDLTTYLNQIITIQGQDNCFSISTSDTLDPNATTVIVDQAYGTCPECSLAFKFINCRDNQVSVYSVQDYSQYVDPNKVVTLEEYPGECWTIIRNTDAIYTPEIVIVEPKTFDLCEECLGTYFYLTSCSNEQSFILTDTDLTNYLDQIVSIVGFPGACFLVEAQACNCISVRLFSRVSGLRTYKVERAPVLLNGRNQYTIVTNKNERILIAFDTEENRWEVWNIDTDTLLSYSILATDCPYTGIWENIDENAFRMISITSCETSIYTVEVEDTYEGCECCLFKNC